jgi:hypothetical protein
MQHFLLVSTNGLFLNTTVLTFGNKASASPVKRNRSPDERYVDEERSKRQKVPEVVVPAESE